MNHPMSGQTLLPNQMYSSYTSATHQPEHGSSIEGITDAVGNLSLTNGTFTGQDLANSQYPHASRPVAKASANTKVGNLLYQMPDGHFSAAPLDPLQPTMHPFTTHAPWLNAHGPAIQGALYRPYTSNGAFGSFSTPRGQQGLPSQHLSPVPDLMEPRRTSWSSREEASPQTPTFGPPLPYNISAAHSPSAYSSTYSGTPSPMSPHNAYFVWKRSDGEPIYIDFWSLINREPQIPEPVPAIHSGPDGGRGTLDKILDNRDGTTNVYVRGLQPNTSDEMLQGYGSKFGQVVSCKSIIDASSGHCKGFGFIKYHNYVDAENCIRGFYHRGYEAKFARKSHNSRLKDLARIDNTNLYVSNLPRLINEEGLKKLFQTVFPEQTHPHHQAGSCKILKDSCGVSRGVGFARFETPGICEEIIGTFNNRALGEGSENTILQIRYADTEEQKQLKAFTAIKRQFKADEYNEAVYGIPFGRYSSDEGSHESPLQNRAPGLEGSWLNNSPVSSVSPAQVNQFRLHLTIGLPNTSGLVQYPNSMVRSRQASSLMSGIQPLDPSLHEPSPPSSGHKSPVVKIENPGVTIAIKNNATDLAEQQSSKESSVSGPADVTRVEKQATSTPFVFNGLVASPTRPKL